MGTDTMRCMSVILVITCLVGAGCAGGRTYITEGTRVGTRVDSPQTEARLNRVGFLTKGLERRVAVQRTAAERTATNTLEVWCTFRNRTDFPQQILVRISYFGPGRVPNEEPTAWQPLYLAPNSIETFRMRSATTDAAFYYIEVQEGV